jgi:hypothetical protein
MKSGLHMLATIVGGALAFVLLGLPLAIIGLFVQGALAKSSALRAERNESFARIDEPSHRGRGESPPEGAPLAASRIAIKAKPAAEAAASAAMRRHGRAQRPGVTPDPHAIVAAAAVLGDGIAPGCASDRRA